MGCGKPHPYGESYSKYQPHKSVSMGRRSNDGHTTGMALLNYCLETLFIFLERGSSKWKK